MKLYKHILELAIVASIAFASCNRNAEKVDSAEQLQTGDLVFVGLPLDFDAADTTEMSSAIAAATGDSTGIN